MRTKYYFSIPDALTSHEQEITRLTCLALSNKEIATRLNLKVAIMKVYLHQIFRKVGVKNRTELVAALMKRVGPG
jgi:DNA-binding NarL/FixJ family response regulator